MYTMASKFQHVTVQLNLEDTDGKVSLRSAWQVLACLGREALISLGYDI